MYIYVHAYVVMTNVYISQLPNSTTVGETGNGFIYSRLHIYIYIVGFIYIYIYYTPLPTKLQGVI